MPRRTSINRTAYIPIPKDMNRLSYAVKVTDSDGTEHDVTNDLVGVGTINRIATEGLSNFSFMVDNTEAKYKDVFGAGDYVDFYYNFKESGSLSTIRLRGYIDGVFNNFDFNNGWTISIEGRDSPKSSNDEHFADTEVTLQFTARNNLDCWLGVDGDTDSEGNIEDGILYNSGLILKVYDTSDNTWKVYKDLSEAQKDTLKAQTGYTQTHTNTYVDKSRLSISREVAVEGDYDFRIFYDSSDSNWYLMVHPEEAVTNENEHVTSGQNLISLGRYGKDTLTEYNRIKEKGYSDGNILLMRTKQDTTKHSELWIKDKTETSSSLTDEDSVEAKASARLNELKEAPKKGGLVCCGLPTLQPAERFHLNLPYIEVDYVKAKSFVVNFGPEVGLEFNIDLKDRETTFERIFKDRIDENVSITSSDNPNGMRNSIVYNFSDSSEYTLTDCQIEEEVLSLSSGASEGTCLTVVKVADENVTDCELRIKANQFWNCTYRISNDNGSTFETLTPGELHTFASTGKDLILEVSLKESTSGVSPEFDKLNILYK